MNVDIANILVGYIDGLPFIDKITGLVKTVTFTQSDGEKSVKKAFPVGCDVTHNDCTTGRLSELVPNSTYKSIIYFEDGGVRPLGEEARGWGFQSSLKLVGWLNGKKLGKTSCSIASAAVIEILNALPKPPINSSPYTRIKIDVTGEDVRSNAIFSKYTYDETVLQYLFYPFDYFALNIVTDFVVPYGCKTDWVVSDPITCE